MPGYPHLERLPVRVLGRELNVLEFDPRTARELLHGQAINRLVLSLKVPSRAKSRDIAPILQRQWRENIGVQLSLLGVEQTAWEDDLTFKRHRHVIEESWSAYCDDPNDFLVFFGP